jgi:serine/threonine protein kinase
LRLISEARLAGVTLAAGGALALVSQAARAVGYAHGRGLTHLGLAPTNVIVTADGDIKITDFGILSATLPSRPLDTPRLAQRIPYLAPEQLANEATSAATDVFALGVLAYELVTGSRTFKGDTPQQVASAIMAGPPAEPPLPRPIARVLQRCLARSPFERFPDARALADALDAALRVAPVPGTRKDIGAQVKETVDRLTALNEGELSGMVALHLGTGPIRRLDEGSSRGAAPDPLAMRLPGEPPAYELARPDPSGAPGSGPLGGPPGAPTFGPSTTMPDLPRPMTTVPGLAPPPIPVPPGVSGPTSSLASGPPGTSTLLGMGKSPPAIPALKPRAASVSGLPIKVPPISARPSTRSDLDPSIAIEPAASRASLRADTDSSIHALDPGDIMPLDAGLAEPLELDAIDDQPATEDDSLADDRIASATRADADRADDATGADDADRADDAGRTRNGGRATRPAGEFPTTPSGRITTPAAPAAIAALPPDERASYRLERGGLDTRPIAPAVLDPLLRDPMNRPSMPASSVADAPAGEPGTGFASEPGPDFASEPRPDANAGDPASPDARLGRTMLGFAAPIVPMATRASGPHARPTAAERPPSGEQPIDELSAMALESFRTVPPTGASPTPGGFAAPATSNGSAPHPAPTAPRADGWPHARTSVPEPAPSEPPPPRLAPPIPPGWVTAPSSGSALPSDTNPPKRRRGIAVIAGMIGAAVIGVGAWQLYVRNHTPNEPDRGSAVIRKPPVDAVTSAQTAPVDAKLAAAPADAAPADARSAPADAGKLAPPVATPTAASDTLAIASAPAGARVFLDGSDAGATPLKLAGSPDRHNLALLLAGHELYIAQVDGHGSFQIPLKEVTPSNGPAGIKVLRCKDKDRYYVFIDGKPTGQTCPTERIGCEVGPHTVEVYDVVSETRRKWDIVVKDTRLSFRVRVE